MSKEFPPIVIRDFAYPTSTPFHHGKPPALPSTPPPPSNSLSDTDPTLSSGFSSSEDTDTPPSTVDPFPKYPIKYGGGGGGGRWTGKARVIYPLQQDIGGKGGMPLSRGDIVEITRVYARGWLVGKKVMKEEDRMVVGKEEWVVVPEAWVEKIRPQEDLAGW